MNERRVGTDACVHDLFDEQARRTPDAVALVSGREAITYAALARRANQLAHYLRGLGVGLDVPVGIYMDRSPEFVVALLGVLKAGGAYLPLDPAYPLERLRLMVDDAQPSVMLTESGMAERLQGTAASLCRLDAHRARIAAQAVDPPSTGVRPDNLFYIIYTSGSTGRPKGAQVTHRAIPGFIFDVDFARFDERAVLLQHSSVSWDALTLELWPALLTGGRCVLCPRRIMTAADLREHVRPYGVNTLWLTPAVFNAIVDVDPACLAGVETLLTGGEAPSPAHLARALERFPHMRIVNGYGPSECTVFSSSYVVPSPLPGDVQSIPIGAPTGDRRVYVLDAWMRPVPARVTGEGYIGGPSVARGYVGRPRLTAAQFVPNPFAAGERLYRTGDLLRWAAPGSLAFVGRVDQQVKIGGVRIELEEIEAALDRHPGVAEAAVVVREDVQGDKRLVAYVVPQRDRFDSGELRAHLKERLPDYLIPSALVALDALPLTPNGKLDRRALTAMKIQAEVQTTAAGPRDRLEHELIGIWEHCLGIDGVGIRDNFFELGGSSVTALRCLGQINRAFQTTVPVAALFQHPTIETLGAVIRASIGDRQPSSSPLLVFRAPPPSTKEPPFFAIHPGGGFALCYRELARRLDDCAVYAVQSPGVELTPEAREWTVGSIETVASRYIDAIKAAAPDGPYRIGGWSFGATVAFEIARQLHAYERSVALLVLFDLPPWAPGAGGYVRADGTVVSDEGRPDPLSSYADDAEFLAELFCGVSREAMPRLLPAGSLDERIAFLLRYTNLYREPTSDHIAWALRLAALAKAHEDAARRYVPSAFGGRTLLFQATGDGPLEQDLSALRGVTAGGLEICRVPGTHMTMLRNENAAMVARHLMSESLAAGDGGYRPEDVVHG